MALPGSQFRKHFTEVSTDRPQQSASRSLHNKNEAKAQSDPVKITFDLPVDAADRLSQLAESSDHSLLRELGIVSFQLQGDKIVSLTLAGSSHGQDGDVGMSTVASAEHKPEPSFSIKKEPSLATQSSSSSTSTSSLSLLPALSIQALDLLKGSSVSLKRVAPSGSARPSFHTSGSSSAFNNLGHSPEKKRRKQANPSSKDSLFSSGAMSCSSPIASGLSEVLAAAAAAAAASRTSTSLSSDGSHFHRLGQHGSSLSKSASLTISSLSAGDAHTQSNALSRIAKTLMVDNLMPPPPPLHGEVTTDTKDLSNKFRPARLNPNTGLLETRVSDGESSSEGDEGDQELECRSSIRSLDLAITNNKKETVVVKPHHQRKQSQPQPVKLHHSGDMALKLKLKLPPVQSSTATSRTSSHAMSRSSGVTKRFESQDEPKLPKLILSMRDKTVKMAGAKTLSAACPPFMESGRDGDCDDSDDDDEEFDSIKMKSSVAVISRTLPATKPKTSDSRNAHLEPVSTTSTTTTTSPPHLETTKIMDSSKVTISNNHFKDSVWSKSSLGIKCNDEINLRLSVTSASATTAAATTTSTKTITIKSEESMKSSSEQIKREKDVFPQLVNDKEHLKDKPSSRLTENDNKRERHVATLLNQTPDHLATSPRVNFADSFNLASRDDVTDSQVHQGDDSGIESMDTLSEKSPNQGENPHDDKMLELKDLVATSLRSSPLVRPLNCIDKVPQLSMETATTENKGTCEPEPEDKSKVEENDRLSPVLLPPPVVAESQHEAVTSICDTKICTETVTPAETTKAEEVELQPLQSTKEGVEKNVKSNVELFLTKREVETKEELPLTNIIGESSTTTVTTDTPAESVTLEPSDAVITPSPSDADMTQNSEDEDNKNVFLSSRSASLWLASDSNLTAEPATAPTASVVVNAVTEDQTQQEQAPPQQQQPIIFTKAETAALTSVLSSGMTIQSSALRRSPAPPTTTSSLNGGYSSAGLQSMRSALNVPAGAKMVPVKLVSVSGEGNMRLVRVSPVKTSLNHDGGSSLPPRTVVIKSSMLKTVPSKVVTASTTPNIAHLANTTPLPAHLANSQPLSPSLLNNVGKETAPTSVYNLITSSNLETVQSQVAAPTSLPNCVTASVLNNLELLTPQTDSFTISAEIKEKLLAAVTLATTISSPAIVPTTSIIGSSLSITPVWNHTDLITTSAPSTTSSSSNLTTDKATPAVITEPSSAFALKTLVEPVSVSGPKVELEVDTKNVGAKGRPGVNRPQKKSPLSVNSDFGGSLLRPLLQKEEPLSEVKAKPKAKPDSESVKPADNCTTASPVNDSPPPAVTVITVSESVPEPEVTPETNFIVTSIEDGDESNSSNASRESDDNTDGNLLTKTGLKKSGRIESNKINPDGKVKIGGVVKVIKGVTVAVATPAGSIEDPKERRSVRQITSNTDGTTKIPSTKIVTKKVTNSVVLGLDKDSTSITDWAAKSKRVVTTAATLNAAATSSINSVVATCSNTSITNSCNVVVETNKNFAEKRIKTRSAKTTDEQLDVKRRRLKIENA